MLELSVLDHGVVRLRNLAGPTRRTITSTPIKVGGVDGHVETWHDFDADDVDPANTARMSFDQMDAGRSREADLKLCDYLMKNRHTTPFEMIEVWLEMKMPIFCARQFVRHRTVSINEVSARYVQLPGEWYVPKHEHVGFRPANAKQGRQLAWDELTDDQKMVIGDFCTQLDLDCRRGYELYERALANGIPPELARCHLHVNHYTHWVWKQNLHNLMHFLSLRDHSHAQFEAQAYAKATSQLLRQFLPNLMDLYDRYRRLPE